MRLYLVQHGKAKSKEEDPERDLSKEGLEEAKRISAAFAEMKPDIHVIWHSGKRRAQHTAEIIAGALDIQNRIMEHTGLAPRDEVSDIRSTLEKTHKNLAIVGHLPHLSHLSSLLLAGNTQRDLIRFRNAGIVCLEKDEGRWRLVWMLTPDIL